MIHLFYGCEEGKIDDRDASMTIKKKRKEKAWSLTTANIFRGLFLFLYPTHSNTILNVLYEGVIVYV